MRHALIPSVLFALLPSLAEATRCEVLPSNGAMFMDITQLRPQSVEAQGSFTVRCDIAQDPTVSPVMINPLTGMASLSVIITMGPDVADPQNRITPRRFSFTSDGATAGPAYNYFTDAGRNSVFGDGAGNGVAITHTFNYTLGGSTAQEREFNVFGRVYGNVSADARKGYRGSTVVNVEY